MSTIATVRQLHEYMRKKYGAVLASRTSVSRAHSTDYYEWRYENISHDEGKIPSSFYLVRYSTKNGKVDVFELNETLNIGEGHDSVSRQRNFFGADQSAEATEGEEASS